MTELAYDSRGP